MINGMLRGRHVMFVLVAVRGISVSKE